TAASRGRPRRDRAGVREPTHQPEPLRRRPEHGQRSAGHGRRRASRQGRLLAGGVPRANQLCRGGTGDWDTDSRFSGGDAMIHPTSSVVILGEDLTERSFPLPVVILSEDFSPSRRTPIPSTTRVSHPFALLWQKGRITTISALV